MSNNSKRVCIFGSTGSIGCNALEVIENLKRNGKNIEVIYLSTNSNIEILASQIRKYSPKGVVILNLKSFTEFKSKYYFENLEIFCGREGLIEASKRDDYDFLLNALVGFSGLEPTIEAIKSGKDIAIANKETMVVAGKLVTDLAKKNNTKLIPIDSEHSAILQCIAGEDKDYISKIILTASGGPFLNKSIDEIRKATVEDALAHPNWKMGNKITIDSATMMNKGLEVIEAKWLFEIDIDKIEVIIHPQSIIHSFVEFIDGSVKAQMGIPDMKIPIQYSLTYPERVASDYPRLNFKEFKNLTFLKPDIEKFKCIDIAFDVLRKGGTYAAVMNAANEMAVDLFLKGKISFDKIPEIIVKQLQAHNNVNEYTLENIIEADALTRNNIIKDFLE